MKTKLHKTLLLFVLVLFAVQVQGQAFSGDNVYRIKVQGEDLYLTLPDEAPITSGSQILTYQPLDNTNKQIFTIQAVAGETSTYTITSVISGKGVVEIDDSTVTNPSVSCKGNTAGVAENLDWWNPTRGSGTQLFSENNSPNYDNVAKRRLQNTIGGADLTGTDVKLSGGGPLALDYVVSTPLSTDEFDTSAVSISNPVDNNLTIKGLTSNIKEISIYTILGKKVLSKTVNTQDEINLDVSPLATGLYIVEMKGENSKVAKKIIKQ